jgi:hypothetical protein
VGLTATVRPSAGESAYVGRKAVCSPGLWTGATSLRFLYKWRRNGSLVVSPPSDSPSYLVQPGVYRQLLSCTVLASGDGKSGTATSAAVPVGGPLCFGLRGEQLLRCRAKAAYESTLARCAAIDTSTGDMCGTVRVGREARQRTSARWRSSAVRR